MLSASTQTYLHHDNPFLNIQLRKMFILTQDFFSPNLRLLPTFAGVLREKIRMRATFTKILANYTSEESLINAVYDKKII